MGAISRRDFLTIASGVASCLVPTKAGAAEADSTLEIISNVAGVTTLSCTDGIWTVSMDDKGAIRTASVQSTCRDSYYLEYNSESGAMYSSPTNAMINYGTSSSLEDSSTEDRGLGDVPILRNASVTYEEEPLSWNEIQDAVGKAAYFADVCIYIATKLKLKVPDVVSLLSIVASGILTFVNGGDSTSGIIIKYKITVREQFIPFPEHWAYYDTIRTPVSYRFY